MIESEKETYRVFQLKGTSINKKHRSIEKRVDS